MDKIYNKIVENQESITEWNDEVVGSIEENIYDNDNQEITAEKVRTTLGEIKDSVINLTEELNNTIKEGHTINVSMRLIKNRSMSPGVGNNTVIFTEDPDSDLLEIYIPKGTHFEYFVYNNNISYNTCILSRKYEDQGFISYASFPVYEFDGYLRPYSIEFFKLYVDGLEEFQWNEDGELYCTADKDKWLYSQVRFGSSEPYEWFLPNSIYVNQQSIFESEDYSDDGTTTDSTILIKDNWMDFEDNRIEDMSNVLANNYLWNEVKNVSDCIATYVSKAIFQNRYYYNSNTNKWDTTLNKGLFCIEVQPYDSLEIENLDINGYWGVSSNLPILGRHPYMSFIPPTGQEMLEDEVYDNYRYSPQQLNMIGWGFVFTNTTGTVQYFWYDGTNTTQNPFKYPEFIYYNGKVYSNYGSIDGNDFPVGNRILYDNTRVFNILKNLGYLNMCIADIYNKIQ